MNSPRASGERSTYSPSFGCFQSFRPFYVDARVGCRFSAQDRQKLRDRNRTRNDRGIIVDRYPAFRSHLESRRVTRLNTPRALPGELLAKHYEQVNARPVADPALISQKRADLIMAELVATVRCGLTGAKLKAHLAADPELSEMTRELVRLTGV